MVDNITSVTVLFGNGSKKEEYGPVKKAEVSLTAAVPEGEDGSVILAQLKMLAMAGVADMLTAPRPQTAAEPEQNLRIIGEVGAPPPRRTRRTKEQIAADEAAAKADAEPAADPEVTFGKRETMVDGEIVKPEPQPAAEEDEWATEPVAEVTDREMLDTLSRRAQELGGREAIHKLILSFATRTEAPPFKPQEIPQAQRKDFMAKLAALTA